MNSKKSNNETPKSLPKTNLEFLKMTLQEIIKKKRWLLLPFWVLLTILAGILFLSGHSAILPAIYILF